LENSFQWSSFQKAIEDLRDKENQIFVLIGPFNPYLQTEESLVRYNVIRQAAEQWLSQNNLDYYSPTDLPSELYADASHPLKEGYTRIAEELFRQKPFGAWLNDVRAMAASGSPTRNNQELWAIKRIWTEWQ